MDGEYLATGLGMLAVSASTPTQQQYLHHDQYEQQQTQATAPLLTSKQPERLGGDSASSTRSLSPSPSASPSTHFPDDIQPLSRSFTTPASSTLSLSAPSSSFSENLQVGRRRGFLRPQGTAFADSARCRDSVMSLGSIAHVQHYFARTGLLDGKGAQHWRRQQKNGAPSLPASSSTSTSRQASNSDSSSLLDMSIPEGTVRTEPSESQSMYSRAHSEADVLDVEPTDETSLMLPPTVSLYKQRAMPIVNPPDLAALRRELKEALDDTRKVLREVHDSSPATNGTAMEQGVSKHKHSHSRGPGFDEIEGLHLLDIVTLAIRATKNYYLAHGPPLRLVLPQKEENLRSDLYRILDLLKSMVARNFIGGIKHDEWETISGWVNNVNEYLKWEEAEETRETSQRDTWEWRSGDWTGRERTREHLFLSTFDTNDSFPEWTDPANSQELPTPFLRAMQDGLNLVHLHNALVAKSPRRFEEIKVFHTDTTKPYRAMDNLRYWVKAAELRWEIKLIVPVSAVVHGKDLEAWRQFDGEILRWSSHVRVALDREWKENKVQS